MKHKIIASLVLTGLIGVNSAYADIDDTAPSASHHLEQAIDEIHDYLHHHYDNSYSSHAFETVASNMHHMLHEWSHGEVGEEEISMLKAELKSTWNTFKQNIHVAQVLNQGDDDLDALYEEVKVTYKHLRFLLKKSD